MEQHKRLALYEKALEDWSKPYVYGNSRNTDAGFCHYFFHIHGIDVYHTFDSMLPELNAQRETPEWSPVHYLAWGDTLEGRSKRVEALKTAIELCNRNPITGKSLQSRWTKGLRAFLKKCFRGVSRD